MDVDRIKEAQWDKYKSKNFPPSKTREPKFHLNMGHVRKAFLAGLNMDGK